MGVWVGLKESQPHSSNSTGCWPAEFYHNKGCHFSHLLQSCKGLDENRANQNTTNVSVLPRFSQFSSLNITRIASSLWLISRVLKELILTSFAYPLCLYEREFLRSLLHHFNRLSSSSILCILPLNSLTLVHL